MPEKNKDHVFEFKAIIFAVNDKNCSGCLMKSISDTINMTKKFRLAKIVGRKIEKKEDIELITKLVKNKK